jgi:Gametolysin peptidase M11
MHIFLLFIALGAAANFSLGVFYIEFQGKEGCYYESYKLPCQIYWNQERLENSIYKDKEKGNVVDFYKEVSNHEILFLANRSSIHIVKTLQQPTDIYNSLFNIIKGEIDVNPLIYDYQIFLFPSNWHRIDPLKGSFTLGVGELNGRKTWIKGRDTDVLLHELGHNFGFGHSNSYRSDGSIRRYGDMSSVMGDSNGMAKRSINSAHRYQRGWTRNEEIVNVDKELFINSTTLYYTLLPLSYINNGDGIKMIIFNINDVIYYIEYRTKLNYDDGLGTASSYNTKTIGDYYNSILVRTKDSNSDTLLEGIIGLNTFMNIGEFYISHYKDLGNITISKEYPEFPTSTPKPSNSDICIPSLNLLVILISLILIIF